MTTFITSMLMVGLSEMGDKTQLLVLAFAAQCGLSSVAVGVVTGILATNLLAVTIGSALGLALPLGYIKLGAGVLFLIFAAWTLLGSDEEESVSKCLRSPWAVAGAFFLAELADKTQLATLTLAANYKSFLPVWIGASTGMVLAIALAVLVGSYAGKHLPEKTLKILSAGVFAVFGIVAIIDGIGRL